MSNGIKLRGNAAQDRLVTALESEEEFEQATSKLGLPSDSEDTLPGLEGLLNHFQLLNLREFVLRSDACSDPRSSARYTDDYIQAEMIYLLAIAGSLKRCDDCMTGEADSGSGRSAQRNDRLSRAKRRRRHIGGQRQRRGPYGRAANAAVRGGAASNAEGVRERALGATSADNSIAAGADPYCTILPY